MTPWGYTQGSSAFLKPLYISRKSHTVRASNTVEEILQADILVGHDSYELQGTCGHRTFKQIIE